MIAQRRNLGDAGRIGDQRHNARVLQPIVECIGAEERRQRQGDGAKLVDGEMRERDFMRLRQENRHTVALLHAFRAQRIGEPVRLLAQSAICESLDAAISENLDDRDALRIARRPAVAAIDADIVARRNVPPERRAQFVVIVNVGHHGKRKLTRRNSAWKATYERRLDGFGDM